MRPRRRIVVVALAALAVGGNAADASTDRQGLSWQGLSWQGLSWQGLSWQGLSWQGLSWQGLSWQGLSWQGLSWQGLSWQGLSWQGLSWQGLSWQGLSWDGGLRGIDRARGLAGAFQARGIARADVQFPGVNLQGLQSGAPLRPVQVPNPMNGVRLQAGPADSGPGSFLYVPGVPDLTGTFWNQVLDDGSDRKGGVVLYIAAVEQDASRNASVLSSNEDVYLYTVYYQHPATGEWAALCPLDGDGKARAMAIPLDPRDWIGDASRAQLAFACTASGVAAKCARNWGYKPWNAALAPYYNACLIAGRADYCQDDRSFTREGTLVDLFDSESINPTVGLPFAPNASGVMLAEEYQISVASHVADVLPDWWYMSLPGDEQALVSRLLRSGLQSSRYADLDPGRSCPASPYIDRCSGAQPDVCTRADNMPGSGGVPYGPFLAVNSARQCAHSDSEPGEPLAPGCNACTSRVCELDSTCCGNPGPTFYPRLLAWDDHCVALRDQVCRSSPDQPPWPAGKAVDPPGSRRPVFLRGAAGSFEALVTGADGTFAEGWACDPDFSDASSPIQISVGGPLGATGATPSTAIADQPLAAGWREAVAATCGGGERHGFRVPLPDDVAGKDVFVYGVDLDVPGAPFSLLRGGRKAVPAASPAVNPRGAIWTGWIEPPASGNYTFCRQQRGTTRVCASTPEPANPAGEDRYRIWVNGRYLAGNWVDDDATVPGAFTLPPPTAPVPLYLLRGVRYAIRLEYQRPAELPATSELALLWSVDGAPPVELPTASLHALGQPDGTGLQAAFFSGHLSLDALPENGASGFAPAVGSLDELWTATHPPASGLSVEDSFAARLEGQLVPPISGDYTFSAETDGLVRITVDGRRVTDTSREPAGLEPETCAHDICVTGAAINKTCKQASFCAARVCIADASCCAVTWDARCTQEVNSVCGIDCFASPPIAISLAAGRKYDVKVEYVHAGGRIDTVSRVARLKVMWALPQTPREVIPIERLFAPSSSAAAVPGTGLDVAYFSDGAFTDEYLSRVEPAIDFRGTSLPVATRASGLVCGTPGGSTCVPSGTLGAPSLLAARFKSSAGGGAVTVEVSGGGAVRNATVSVFEGAALLFALTSSADASDGGLFRREVALMPGLHRLTVMQSAGGLTSGSSAPLDVNVVDPGAPPPPQVSQPGPARVTSGDGRIAVAGTAAPGATVTVTATAGGAGGTTISATFTADAAGNWAGTLTLRPGSHDLGFTQTVNGATSGAGAPAAVDVALPPLTVASPADGAVFTCPQDGTGTCPVRIDGQGAAPQLGDVVVAAGDAAGRFFVDLDPRLPVRDGSFAGTVALDYGRHLLKILQRANGLDGDGQLRTVIVRPPLGSLAITRIVSGGETTQMPAPAPGPVVDPSITVAGSGGLPRTGLGGTVTIYQGATPLAEAPLDDLGAFEVPVFLSGAGIQTLSVSQTARSLSGGGGAESDRAAVTVRLRPDAPVIAAPLTGTDLPNVLTLDVRGTAVPGATVTFYANGVAQAPQTVATPAGAPDAGSFAARLAHLAAGNYRLTARATLDGATGPESEPPVLVALGDVTPPTVTVARNPVLASAEDESGADVDIAALVRAFDNGQPLPASSIACSPAQAPAPRFPVGSTSVTCEAHDAAGNRGATTFVVTVTSGEPPSITATGQIAEAQGPAGAVVNYQVAASGFVADCGAPGANGSEACSVWRPANRGLGFRPETLAMNTGAGDDRGALYTMVSTGSDSAHKVLFRLPPGGAEWQELGGVGAQFSKQIVVGAGAPPALYVPSDDNDPSPRQGIMVSRDGGRSWSTALEGTGIDGIAVDPHDPARLHQYGWRSFYDPGPTLYETHDGWVTWSAADQGLPPERIKALAFDPLTPDRLYLSVQPAEGDEIVARMFRRVAGGPWEPLGIPLSRTGSIYEVREFFIAPTADGCGPSQKFPTIFAGHLVSRDGGDSWVDVAQPLQSGPEEMSFLFDRSDPCTVYAWSFRFHKSVDGGRTWPISGPREQFVVVQNSVVQDLADARTLYHADTYQGVFKTTDGGASWSLIAPTGFLSREAGVVSLAADPVDPNIVLAVALDGSVIRSTDRGDHWQFASRMAGQGPLFTINDEILVDPAQRNKAYSGHRSIGNWAVSLDGGVNWAPLLNDAGLPAVGSLAVDPLVPGHWLAIAGVDDRRTVSLRDNAHIGGTGEIVVQLEAASASALLPEVAINPGQLQMVPDAARTVLMSWGSGSRLRAGMFSLSQARPGTPLLLDGIGEGAPVVYDGSDGTQRLFVDGAWIGGAPNVLHRTTVAEARRGSLVDAPWEPLGGGPDIEFGQLVIDPASGGQALYTIGTGGTLWESHDGGRRWRQDQSVPSAVVGLWLSPADGALFAELDSRAYAWDAVPDAGPSGLWKRAPDTGAPARGRIRKGDLRVTCIPAVPGPVDPTNGLPLRATAPGSTFPIGDTVLGCTATDVFGNTGTASITISVRDTTPPVITVDAFPAPAVAPSGGTAGVSFAVSARDAVDGPRPVSCTHAPGSAFSVGITTVTCTASDDSAPPHTTQVSFPVIVSEEGRPPIGVPALALPDFIEAVGPAGAPLAATAATWNGTPLTPTCAPAAGSMLPIGVSTVSCSVSDPATRLSFTWAGDVTVRDTTAPAVAVPGDLVVDAQGAFGARVTYDATASDVVDGAVAVSCAPDAGAVFPLGATMVSCHAVDRAGNQGFSHFQVTVVDRSPATLRLADITVDADAAIGSRVTFTPAPAATDIAGRPVAIECAPPSGSLFPTGATTVTCTGAPGTPNEAEGSFTVMVVDRTGPTLTAPPPITITRCGASADIGIATATDAVSPPVTITSDRPTTFALGTTVVTYSARDARGNASTATQVVTAALGDDPSCCPPGTNVIIGTAGNDVLRGTAGRDCILGRGGADRISGGGGDDAISGGAGNDIIDGGVGNDQIFGGGGDDVLHGGPGDDRLVGEGGNDLLDAGPACATWIHEHGRTADAGCRIVPVAR